MTTNEKALLMHEKWNGKLAVSYTHLVDLRFSGK